MAVLIAEKMPDMTGVRKGPSGKFTGSQGAFSKSEKNKNLGLFISYQILSLWNHCWYWYNRERFLNGFFFIDQRGHSAG